MRLVMLKGRRFNNRSSWVIVKSERERKLLFKMQIRGKTFSMFHSEHQSSFVYLSMRKQNGHFVLNIQKFISLLYDGSA